MALSTPFGIQFDAAGIYLVGTPTAQFHVAFEEMISFTEGIIALLEYGVTWKVLQAVLGRMRHRVWQRAEASLEEQSPLWIDSSGPILYELRHGVMSILVSTHELESSRFGKMIKKQWDGGLVKLEDRYVAQMIFEALVIGIWRNMTRRLKFRKIGL